MSGLDIDSAKELVEKIAEDHGFISEKELATLPEAMRKKITHAFNVKDSIIGSGAVTLARNLYSSTARFIFELLQNADDNSYEGTRKAGGDPCVSFRVYHDRLVLECNEDGFTPANVKAICNLGKSSKKGPFSFYFEHRKKDTGIGMINPIWFDPELTLPKNTTRMTLHFHEDVKKDDIAQLLYGLQVEILLFLQKLKVINISVYDEGNETPAWSRVVRMKRSDPFSDTAEIRVKETGSSAKSPGQSIYRFFVVRHEARNLERNENREYDAKETETKAWSTSQVIVAFPLDKNSLPIIQPQELFAFMPVRRVGFNFLIHADFVTQANRQDIFSTSPRNIGLRAAIGDAVAKGLAALSTLRSVRYIWMRYLPRQGNLPQDPFWMALVPEIKKALARILILEPESQETTARYYMGSLKCLRPEHRDQYGNPLIPDIKLAPLYLTGKYKSEDINVLREYGLEYLDNKGIIHRLSALTESETWPSRMFDNRDEDWQSRLARLIVKILDSKESNALMRLPLMPLTSKTMRSRQVMGSNLFSSEIFFPETYGVPIPQNLGFQLIFPEAAANRDCMMLYEKLQVKILSVQRVYSLIVDQHTSKQLLSIPTSVSHIKYLYRVFHHLNRESHQLKVLQVFNHKARNRRLFREHTYLPGDEGNKYSPTNWSKSVEISNQKFKEPKILLIHPSYLNDAPEANQKLDKSWVEWLHSEMGFDVELQIISKLKDNQVENLSDEFNFMAEYRSPKVISYLCTKWASDTQFAKFWSSNPQRIELLKDCEFITQNGSTRPLAETYLPIPSLINRCEEFISNSASLQFLKVDDPMVEDNRLGWEAVGKTFTAGITDNMDFYLDILLAINCGDSKTVEPLTVTVTKVYLRIHAHCLASDDRQKSQAQVRDFFNGLHGVLCSPSPQKNNNEVEDEDNQDGNWASPVDCLWDAPAAFESKEPVGARWQPILVTLDSQDRDSLEQFFRRTIGIRDAQSQDIMDELILRSNSESPSLDVMRQIYKKLADMMESMKLKGDSVGLKSIEAKLSSQPLVFIPFLSGKLKKWFTTRECLWSIEGEKLGKPCLERHYPELSRLFVNMLSVPKLDLKLIINELQNIGDQPVSVYYAESLLKSLKIFLTSHPGDMPMVEEKSLLSRVFPSWVPGQGEVQLLSTKDEFAIADRQNYLEALQPHIKVLKFTVSESQQLAPVFEWMGLSNRNLSKLVDEKTVVEGNDHPLDRELTRDFIMKAGAFVSIASHFESPLAASGPQSLYSSLRKLRVYSAEDITTKLCMKQDDHKIQITVDKGVLHINNSEDGQFEIFITADEGIRDFCITSKLPHHFAAALLKCNTSEVTDKVLSVVSSVIHGKPKSMSLILQEKGIPELDQSSLGEPDDRDLEGLDPIVPNSSTELVSLRRFPQPDEFHSHDGSQEPESYWAHEDIGQPSSHSVGPRLRGVRTNYSECYNESGAPEAYKQLLIRVVEVARQHATPLDAEWAFNLNSLTRSLASSSNYGFAARDDMEFKLMVGAAGELFVFESLLKLKLPNLSISAWRSNVRRYVKAHPDYENIPDTVYYGAGDIKYDDQNGELTKVLIERGLLDASWQNSKPEYLILTKTTPSENPNTAFYMGSEQYRKMEEYLSVQRMDTIVKLQACILFRVYGLTSGNIQMKVYTDIDRARGNGELEFVSDGWTVHPQTTSPS